MEPHGDYNVDIEVRATGAPKFRVSVSLAGRTIGNDYASSEAQAEQLAMQMIRRHQQLRRPDYQAPMSAYL